MFFVIALTQAAPAAFAQWDESAHGGFYDYQLTFDFDPASGKFRPAYSYSSSRGSSTIWLDRGSRSKESKKADGKGDKADRSDEERLFISCKWPAGWKVTRTAEKAQAVHPDGSTFTVFASHPLSEGSRRRDFVKVWSSRARVEYGEMSEEEIRDDDLSGTATYSIYTKVDPRGVALAMIYTGGRALPIMIEFPGLESFEEHGRELSDFIGSFEIKRGKIAASK